MTLTEQVYAQAVLLAGEPDSSRAELLNTLCTAVTASLTARLREGLTPDDCKADFIAAASLLVLADLSGAATMERVEEFKAGELTVKRGSADAASNCLRRQAQMLILPYLKDNFSFRGV